MEFSDTIKRKATEHALEVLEFGRIRRMLCELCDSDLGKEAAEQLNPLDDPELIRSRLELIEEVMNSLREAGQPDLGGLYDVRRQIKLAAKDGVLEAEDLWKIGLLADICNRLARFASRGCENRPRLKSLLESIDEIPGLGNRIAEVIIAPGELMEDATPLLKELRKRRTAIHAKLQEKLESYLHNPSFEKYLQEELITLRNGRFVLPVKIEYKTEIQGVIHDRSSSGATLFIEPLPVVEMNNELRELELAEKAERERILRLLTELVRANSIKLECNVQILSHVDFLVACARMSKRFDAFAPIYGESEGFSLINARHPMLLIDEEEKPGFKAVPLDIDLPMGHRSLVITGPNMGGKTVALKTSGLLCAMANSGLPIPADPKSKIPHLSAIFADIGDEQSIDDSLSSFASHVKRWQEAVESADESSLVLIDELGSATDPEEGTPLSRALLEELISRNSYVLVTTHLGGLKALAVATEGVQNGAMVFDQDLLQPTYTLKTGAPGRSWAFEIARRLGLSEKVLERGCKLIGAEGSHIDRLIADLQKKTEEAEMLSAKSKTELRAIGKDRDVLNALIKTNREREHRLEELRKRYDDDKLEMLERELAIEKRKIDEKLRSFRKAEEAAEKARETVKEKLSEVKQEKRKKRGVARDLKKGDRVWLYRMQKHGMVLRETDSQGYITVEIDGLKVRMHSSAAMEPKEETQSKPRGGQLRYDRPQVPIAMDFRGMSFEQAWDNIDKWITNAIVVQLPRLNIIHGKGTGALREKIREKLTKDKRVDEWKIAEMHEGGDGATIVALNLGKNNKLVEMEE
jgi:DNA mismatch repair protein MutS2